MGDFDEGVLETALSRKEILQALATEPHHRQELETAFDISKTTCHRVIRTFDEQSLVRRTESGYEATVLGRRVATAVTQFEDSIATGYHMEPLLEQIESSDASVDADLFTDPSVSWTVSRDRPSLDKGVERVREAERLRVLDWTPVPDLYIERIFQIMVENETSSEGVYPREEVADRLDRFPDLHDELLETGAGHRYWVHEDVPPWGMTIYDDSLVELRAYEQTTGTHMLDATSTDERAVEWALDIFSDYRDQAKPVTAVPELPDWGDYSW